MGPKDKPMKDGKDHLGKAICPHCHGHGYIRINVPSYSEVHQCTTCKSEGEIYVEEPNEETVKLAGQVH